ncbi:MAG: hypothetical protein PHF36_05500, partial [Candidatus Cloacimonetes bacterium]|nr:hypothetical protein [Candidatus Cloacimonadota bacterium]
LDIAGSKSIINRLLILNTISKNRIKIRPGSACNDVFVMLDCLKALGLSYQLIVKKDKIIPDIICKYQQPEQHTITINEAGTVFRFLITRLALEEGRVFYLNLGEKLYSRPFMPLVEALNSLGAEFELLPNNKMIIRGKSIKGGHISLPANISSQFVSSILLSASLFKSPLEISFSPQNQPLASLPYIMMTINLLSKFGVSCSFSNNIIKCDNNKPIITDPILIAEPDYSTSPSYWLLGILLKKALYVPVPKNQPLQGDFAFINILDKLGFQRHYKHKNNQDYLAFTGNFQDGIDVSMRDMPDQVMNLATLALFCKSPTIIRDIEVLRYKESDRINNLIHELKKIGADIEYQQQRLVINPRPLTKQKVLLSSHNDHRLAMIFLILKQVITEIEIDDTSCIKKSAPEFLDFLQTWYYYSKD